MGWGGVMKKIGLVGLALAVPAGLVAIDSAGAADAPTKSYGKSMNCRAPDAPYKKYDCLDEYLGEGFFERLVNYYRLEWGHEAGAKGIVIGVQPFAFEGWARNMSKLSQEIAHFMQSRLKEEAAMWEKLAACHDPSEVVQCQSEFAAKTGTDYVEASQKLSRLMLDFAKSYNFDPTAKPETD